MSGIELGFCPLCRKAIVARPCFNNTSFSAGCGEHLVHGFGKTPVEALNDFFDILGFPKMKEPGENTTP